MSPRLHLDSDKWFNEIPHQNWISISFDHNIYDHHLRSCYVYRTGQKNEKTVLLSMKLAKWHVDKLTAPRARIVTFNVNVRKSKSKLGLLLWQVDQMVWHLLWNVLFLLFEHKTLDDWIFSEAFENRLNTFDHFQFLKSTIKRINASSFCQLAISSNWSLFFCQRLIKP